MEKTCIKCNFSKLKIVPTGEYRIHSNTKIKLYKAHVKSVLIYNIGARALTQTALDKLDTFYRKQSRKVLDIYYP